jgi:hypothetical protein
VNRTALSCAFHLSLVTCATSRDRRSSSPPDRLPGKKNSPSPTLPLGVAETARSHAHTHTHTHTRTYIQAGRAWAPRESPLLTVEIALSSHHSLPRACLLASPRPAITLLYPTLACLAYLVFVFSSQAGRQGPSSPSSQNQKSKRGGFSIRIPPIPTRLFTVHTPYEFDNFLSFFLFFKGCHFFPLSLVPNFQLLTQFVRWMAPLRDEEAWRRA